MVKRVLIAGVIALGASGCATEHRTVVVASDDACARYGFTTSSDEYSRCRQLVAEQRRAGRVVVGYSASQIMADSEAACESYGLSRDSAPFRRCVQDEFAARRPG